MNQLSTRRGRPFGVIALALGVLILPVGQLAADAPAYAAGQVTVESPLGGSEVAADAPTSVRLSGNGFQSIQGGFGGIYIFFGWVKDGAWQPSAGGQTGTDLLYVPDSETKENQGYQRFVTFPGSGTSAAANGGEVSVDGTWAVDLTIPGATFTAQDRTGASKVVDCRTVTCGIITIGAHGVVNPVNESFTPISFVGEDPKVDTGGDSPAEAGPESIGGPAADSLPEGPAADDDETVAPGAASTASLGVGNETILAGRVLTFNARGFMPGEQVNASVSAGLLGAGPLQAGEHGEVAGAVQLPADMRPGTHTIKVSAAASGAVAQTEFSVVADAAQLAVQGEAVQEDGTWYWPLIAALITGGLLFLVLLTSLLTALFRRKAVRAVKAETDAEIAEDAFRTEGPLSRSHIKPATLKAQPTEGGVL
ncbi:hypothetical protein ACX80Z_01935 [Arthrobacter sp. TMT4-20]